MNFSLPPLLPLLLFSLPTFPSMPEKPLLFLFRKEQVSLGYPQSMACQDAVVLSSSSFIKAEQGSPL